MAVKLHRCPFMFLKGKSHGCSNVQKALDEVGIEYEVVKAPLLPRSRRKDVERLTGQHMVPVIEFEDGTGLREASADLVARIREGRLFEGHGGPGGGPGNGEAAGESPEPA
jgi:glutaredoxin